WSPRRTSLPRPCERAAASRRACRAWAPASPIGSGLPLRLPRCNWPAAPRRQAGRATNRYASKMSRGLSTPVSSLACRQAVAEVGDRPHEAGLERRARLPSEDPPSAGQVGSALFGIVLGQRFVDELAGAAAEIPNPGGQLQHADLIRGAQVDWIGEIDIEQPDHALDQVIDITEAAGLRAVA